MIEMVFLSTIITLLVIPTVIRDPARRAGALRPADFASKSRIGIL